MSQNNVKRSEERRRVIDTSAEMGPDQVAHTVVTVTLPAAASLPKHPVVTFGLPGAGNSPEYFTFDLSRSSGGGQAGWNSRRGWIFVAVDTIGVGEASVPDLCQLSISQIAAANHRTVSHVLDSLAHGAVAEDFPPVLDPVVLGLGHSWGAGLPSRNRHTTTPTMPLAS